ncbi:MAG: TlpA family protein disulfide reductase [Nitrospirae bacterium]|nr:TlpA family protein disulfide reductase [Nitrospirota bacterium]
MKYKGIILVILIAVAASMLMFLPEKREYKEIASIGSPAPDFEIRDISGRLWKLSDLKGKVVFVNFWATWCTVCKAEAPFKEKLNARMQGRPFQMLGILFRDDPAKVAGFSFSYPILVSDNGETAGTYGITGVPETFIIDKNGIIRDKAVGPREWDNPENIALIEKWLSSAGPDGIKACTFNSAVRI